MFGGRGRGVVPLERVVSPKSFEFKVANLPTGGAGGGLFDGLSLGVCSIVERSVSPNAIQRTVVTLHRVKEADSRETL